MVKIDGIWGEVLRVEGGSDTVSLTPGKEGWCPLNKDGARMLRDLLDQFLGEQGPQVDGEAERPERGPSPGSKGAWQLHSRWNRGDPGHFVVAGSRVVLAVEEWAEQPYDTDLTAMCHRVTHWEALNRYTDMLERRLAAGGGAEVLEERMALRQHVEAQRQRAWVVGDAPWSLYENHADRDLRASTLIDGEGDTIELACDSRGSDPLERARALAELLNNAEDPKC